MIPIDSIIGHQIDSVRLGDKRLTARFSSVAVRIDQIGASNSFPAIFKGRGELKGFYRLMNNLKMTPAKVLSGTTVGLEEMAGPGGVLSSKPYFILYQDTTFGKYHDRKTLELGYFNNPETDNGFLLHSGVLTCDSYVPLGVPVQEFIVREAEGHGKSKDRHERAFEDKESYKWVSALQWGSKFQQKTGKKVVHVGDRESDIASYMEKAFELKQDFVVRCEQERCLAGEHKSKLLKPHLASLPVMGTLELNILDEKGKRHCVPFEVRAAKVHLKDVQGGPVGEVLLQQTVPFEGQKELCRWHLATSLPIETLQDVQKIAQIYENRWPTCEDFHKCLKTGCAIEERQFERPNALFNAVALLSILAVRLLRLRHIAQTDPETPMADFLEKDELMLAQHLCDANLKPSDYKYCKENTVLAFVLTIAKLGGHQGISTKGLPGWQTIWKGWNYFVTLLSGINMSKNFSSA